ncbi:glycine betaine ABC transporter substrate-binding protein [Candidatus Entotheonella palauensis]|nr:glycine betaine ABC transporter substrate-binding protein [Candidatus Entotheonella palauensis]
MRRLAVLALLGLLLGSCASQRARVRIGVKPVAGQAIVVHMLKRMIEDHTQLRPTIVACADTYDCLQALAQKRLDLLVNHDVNGRFSAASAASDTDPLPPQLDLTWLDPFRFESGYLLVMPADRAVTLGITSIADLTKLQDGIRMAIPADYLRQARIGPYDLLRRYGLRLRGDLRIISEPEKRLSALFSGKVDVSVVRSDDGLIGAVPTIVLEDPLTFLPPSPAAVVARSTFLQAHPALPDLLRPLQKHLDQETVRQLSYQVQVEGWTPEIVAYRFLRKAELVSDRPTALSRQPEILIAVDTRDHFGVFAPLAVRAVREVYRGQPARLAVTGTLVRDVV